MNIFQRIYQKIKIELLKLIFNPGLYVSHHSFKLVKLGSSYGGWTIIDIPSLNDSTIVSCGLGEDASFDIEIASKYNAKILIVDPTPRAIEHFNEITQNFGKKSSTSYIKGGKQPISSYDLSALTPSNLILCEKALWNEEKTVRFYSPSNKEHVSHSISNFKDHYNSFSDFIEVDAITIDKLIDVYNIKFDLIKLDIEGAEIEVILDMLNKGIYPKQILVEYDELNFPSKKSKSRIQSCHKALLSNGYRLINFDKPSNILYTNLGP